MPLVSPLNTKEVAPAPAVRDVAVFGIPNDDWGEEVKAVIEPREGATPGPDLEREILAWAEDQLAKYKIPRSIDFVDELPRNPLGKVLKNDLRDKYGAPTAV